MQAFIFNYLQGVKTQRINFYLLLLVIFLGLTTCKKEEAATKDYPRLNTLAVSGINASGATFNAEIISGDLSQITEYGFIWDTSEFPADHPTGTLAMKGALSGNKFSGIIHSGLTNGVTYFIRAYGKTNEFLVYGKIVAFISLGSTTP